MKNRFSNWSVKTLYSLAVLAVVFAFSLQGFSQTTAPTPTAADTAIKNVASASYSDAPTGGTTYNSVSNEVTVTVAKVAGLTVTPDDTTSTNTAGNVVPGGTTTYTFTITNTGNFANDILIAKDALSVSAGGTITNVTVGGTPWDRSADYTQNDLAAGGTITVVVTVAVDATATVGNQVTVTLGNATTGTNFDNAPVATGSPSSGEVRTTDTAATNGLLEAKGTDSALVISDAIPQVNLTAPTGPVAAGTDVNYDAQFCNTGAQDLTNAYALITVPAGTVFKPSSLGAAGAITSVEYSTSAALAGATFSTTVPANAADITFVKVFLNPTTLTAGGVASTGAGCVSLTWDVTVNSNFDADSSLNATVTLTGNNSLGTPVSDISDNTASGTGSNPTVTTVSKTGAILVGPNGVPAANGPTDNNDDYQELVGVVATPVAPGTDIGSPVSVTFTNTLRNDGNATDTFTITAPTVPAGSTVEVSFDNGVTWVVIAGSGATTATSPAVDNGTTLNFLTKVTLPATTDSGAVYPTTITATSVTDPTKSNNTLNDVVLGGAMKIEKSFSCFDGTNTNTTTACIPGATVTYTIQYTNISQSLTAYNFKVVEDGDAGTNNWLANTNAVAGSEKDYIGATGTTAGSGVIDAYLADASQVTDSVSSVAPGYVGRLVFQRVIK